MKKVKSIVNALVASTLILTAGCQSTPEPVGSRPFDTNSSEAYNLANQTYLTRNKSPLKDFTQEEIEEAQASLRRESGGDTSILFGTLSLLTGNLTGIISVAGGTAANIANSDHLASQKQWLVTLKSKDFSTEQEAQSYAVETIRSTAIELLESKGNVFSPQKIYDHLTLYTVNGELDLFGLGMDTYNGKQNSFAKNLEGEFVSTTSIANVYVAPYMPFMDGKVKGYEGYEGYQQYLLDLTAALPEGFMFYQPSFPNEYRISVSKAEDWDCSLCRSINKYVLWQQAVPVIYKSGERYSFIKPAP
jgi:hypothetical protein